MGREPRDSVYQFDKSPMAQVERLRKEARGTPAGVKRDQLLRTALQIEEGMRNARMKQPIVHDRS